MPNAMKGSMDNTTTYGILIAAGHPTKWRVLAGWNDEFATRDEAEAMAERARRHDGWRAKVVAYSLLRGG